MTTRRAHLDIDVHLLRLILDLPPGMQILGAAAEQPRDGRVRVVVEGEDCPPPEDDGRLRQVVPIYRRVETGQAHRESIAIYPPLAEHVGADRVLGVGPEPPYK